MRNLKKLVIAAAILSSIVIMVPGAFAVPVGGEVTGFVTYKGTELPLTGCATQSYDFTGVILNGTVSNGSKVFAGSIATSNVYGSSTGCETLNAGKGTVASSSNPAHFVSTAGIGSASGDFYGTYDRNGSVVTVNLTLFNAFVNGSPAPNTNILVTAQFTPNKVNPSNGAIQAASFAGTFQGI